MVHKMISEYLLADCHHKHQLVIVTYVNYLEEMQYEPDDLTQCMHDDSGVPSYLFTLHCVLYETSASQDLRVAAYNLTMVPGDAVPTEEHGTAPFKSRRTTRPHKTSRSKTEYLGHIQACLSLGLGTGGGGGGGGKGAFQLA